MASKPRVPAKVSGTFKRVLPPTSEKPTAKPADKQWLDVPGQMGGKTAPGATPPPNPYGIPDAALPYVQPQLTALKAQEDARRSALTEFTKAVLAELGKQSGMVGSDYDTAIQQSQSLAQAGSDSLKGANGNAAIQQMLQQANAPESQREQVAGNLGNVFNGGAAALFGIQGVMPGQQLIRDKASSQAFADELPGINALAGTAALKNLLAGFDDQRQKVLGTIPDIMDKVNAANAAANKKDIIGSGSTGYYQVDANGNVVKQIIAPAASKPGSPKIFGSSTGGYYSIDPATGAVSKVIDGTGPAAKAPRIFGSASTGYFTLNADGTKTRLTDAVKSNSAGSKTRLQSKTVNGHTVTFNPSTGSYYIPGTTTTVDPNSLKKPAKVSTAAMNQARQFLFAKAHGYDALASDPDTILSASQAAAARNRGDQVLHVGVGKHEDDEIQNLYTTLVQKYGVPARRAFDMVAGQFKEWGIAKRPAYFPKASAAAEPAASTGPKRDLSSALSKEGAGGVYRAPWNQNLSYSQMTAVAGQALAAVDPKLATSANIQALVSRMQQESGGSTAVVNKWDSNWLAGTPSIGLVQTIPSTFNRYALPGHTDIWNPLDNTIAGVRYMLARYGHIVGSNGKGY